MSQEKEPLNENKNHHWLIGYAITVNSVVGAGVLGIPWGYQKTGWTLGIFSQVFATSLSFLLLYLLLQSFSRMEVLSNLAEKGYKIKPMSISDLLKPIRKEDYIIKQDQGEEAESLIAESNLDPEIGNRRYDMCEMAHILLGKAHGQILMIMFVIASSASLIGYCTIFSSSLASIIPIIGSGTCNIYDDPEFGESCRFHYWIYLAIYASIVIPLAIVGLTEQTFFQIVSFIVRIVVMTTMIVTSLYSIFSDTELDDNGSINSDATVFKPLNLGLCLPIVYMATFFKSTISTTTQYVEDKAQNIQKICLFALFSMSFFFLLLGLIVPFATDEVEKMVTLNWRDYSAGDDSDGRSWWTYFIAYLIVILPAVDVLSAFPIIAINLADNIMSLTYGNFGEKEIPEWTMTYYRLAITVPPVLIAIVVYDLSFVSDISGSLCLLGGGIYIPLFAMVTKRLVDKPSSYDIFFFSDRWAWAGLVISIVAFIAIWVLILIYFIS
ncbi:unnamed protein product [Blepharisma stoltei]|uniref:Amino acid transporter transmembrane domain-containing protein n=1 Tax=Blepharisma stoltei TaxID=1481888 RepID=A0AAU9I8E9_9CILI|nr:unnamed protein product [Blepharisma stoltei]